MRGQGRNRRGDVAAQFDLRLVVPIHLHWRGIDVHDAAPAPTVPQPGFIPYGVITDSDDHIRFGEQVVGELVVEQPDAPAEAMEVFARNYPGALIRAYHWQLCPCEQRPRCLCCVRFAGGQPEQEHRALPVVDQSGGGGDRHGIRGAQRFRGDRR